MIFTFEDLLRLQDAPFQFETVDYFSNHELGGRSLKHKKRDFPWSITEIEVNYLYNTILRQNCKRGLDLCTGMGISSLAGGMAMKETGGKILTIDAYIEEYYNNFNYGRKAVIPLSDGWINVNYLISKFQLDKIVFPEVGWSPDDVPTLIEKHFTEPLDYVFIDGGHTEEQIVKDLTCIHPYTDSRTVWLLHDCNTVSGVWTQPVQDFCKEKFNLTAVIKCPQSLGGHNLAMLVKI